MKCSALSNALDKFKAVVWSLRSLAIYEIIIFKVVVLLSASQDLSWCDDKGILKFLLRVRVEKSRGWIIYVYCHYLVLKCKLFQFSIFLESIFNAL